MTYEEIRKHAATGDIFLLEGCSLVSRIIRVFTGQQFSHVALLWWWNDGLYIAEFKEGIGFRIVPASQWLGMQNCRIFYGTAPRIIRARGAAIVTYINTFRVAPELQHYGYLSLVKVWLSQLTGRKIAVRRKVCSTFVQGAWQAAGYECEDTESPGGLLDHCRELYPLTKGDQT